jgi:hypothetical protein
LPADSVENPNDGLDDEIWAYVVTTLGASYKSDLKAHDAAFNGWPKFSVRRQRRMQIYIRYILAYVLRKRLGRDPSDSEILDLAKGVTPKANLLVRGDEYMYEDVFRFSYGRPATLDRTKGVGIDICGTAALGALLEDDWEATLDEVKPQLRLYYSKNHAKLLAAELA